MLRSDRGAVAAAGLLTAGDPLQAILQSLVSAPGRPPDATAQLAPHGSEPVHSFASEVAGWVEYPGLLVAELDTLPDDAIDLMQVVREAEGGAS
jgi:hypothetical protein